MLSGAGGWDGQRSASAVVCKVLVMEWRWLWWSLVGERVRPTRADVFAYTSVVGSLHWWCRVEGMMDGVELDTLAEHGVGTVYE